MGSGQDQALLRQIRSAQDDLQALRVELGMTMKGFAQLEKGMEHVQTLIADWKDEAVEMRAEVHILREMRARTQLLEVIGAVNGQTSSEMQILRRQVEKLSQGTVDRLESHHRRRIRAEIEGKGLSDVLWGHQMRVMHLVSILGGLLNRLIQLEDGFSHRVAVSAARLAPAAWTEPLMPIEVSPSAVTQDEAGLLFGRAEQEA
ncbi:MAG: hypothetical protein KTR25_20100 [Myxococcales bacterium]|nr:hypothetical protein [Myxococcales bacterium]